MEIVKIMAREILDSRGVPTVEVDVFTADGCQGRASVPSGRSKGKYEAWERRDKDKRRFGGQGVLGAVRAVNTEIADILVGQNVYHQLAIDKRLICLDGTENKERLGANAILATSMAVMRAGALSVGLPLYRYVGGINAHYLPRPLMNILNGGKHADNPLDVQEFMIVPLSAQNWIEALQVGSEVVRALKTTLLQNGYNSNVGDEGGFAPDITSTVEALDLLVRVIEDVGLLPGRDVGLALDIAAGELFDGQSYRLDGKKQSAERMTEIYEKWIANYPIVSLEDPLAEDDWDNWGTLTEEIGTKVQLVGDDLFATNRNRIWQGILKNIANAVLIKPNQIGTVSEMLTAVSVAQHAGYRVVLSHRSGETEDTTIADLAVATNCGQVKIGGLNRTDRLAKYNRIIRIAEELGDMASFPKIS